VLRLDREPSYWSHAFLLVDPIPDSISANRSGMKSPVLWESSLTPPPGCDWFSWRNGINPRRLSEYSRSAFSATAAHSVPNIAIIAIGLTGPERKEILKRAENPYVDQLRYDLASLRGIWLDYVCRRSGVANPLTEGNALPSGAYVQFAYDAAGILLAPGAHQRNTSPEHIWAAVRYLRETFRIEDAASTEPVPRPVKAWMCVRNRTCATLPEGGKAPRDMDGLLQRLD
jgi:hypothetical protein